jgi:hypothetical protein
VNLKFFIVQFASWRSVIREVVWAAATGMVGLIVGALTLGITITNLSMRWQTNSADDHTQHYLVATAITDSPFLGPNSRMGFPTTENLFFAPNYDPASAVFLWFESLFTSNGILILNLYQLIGFFSVGFASYFFFRALRVRRWVGIFFALVLTFAPYNFQRVSFGHAFVANYWAVPLVGILVLIVAGPRTNPFETWIAAAPTRALGLWRRILPIVVLTLLVSLSLSYYYVFAAIILGGLLLFRVIRLLIDREKISALVWPFLTVVALVLFVAVQLGVLSLNFDDRYSKYFGVRSPSESEVHAGKITTLLLPWAGTGFHFLAAITDKYLSKTTVSVFAEPPGTPMIAAFAMVLMVAFLLVRAMRSSTLMPSTDLGRFLRDERAITLSIAFLWALLFYIVSGLGAIFAFLVSPEIRAWVRMSIVLTMLSLGFLAVLVDIALKSLKVAVPVVAFLAVIAVVDQLAGVHGFINLQPTNDANLRSFVAKAENLLDPDCGVVQVPLKSYPASGPIDNMSDYNQALPYILATKNTLRWSYGAVTGTKSGDFWAKVHTTAEFESAVRKSGACAIEVDLAAYATDKDRNDWKTLVNTVSDADNPAIVSGDSQHRYQLFAVENR